MSSEPLSRSATKLLARLYERDLSTHGVAVANLTIGVGQELGLAEADIAAVMRAAVFHDVGKVELPRELLDSPRALRPREWAVMRTHPERGERLVRGIGDLASLAPVVRHHHERWDGDGYPDRLIGRAIPLGARIVFVCDAFDAMTSPRPYRPTLSVDEALEEMRLGAGTQFDPVVAFALMKSVTSSTTLARTTAVRHH